MQARAIEKWPRIEFINEVSGNQFTVRLQRPLPQWTLLREPDALSGWAPRRTSLTPPVTPLVTPHLSKLLTLLALQGTLGNQAIRQAFQLKDRRRLRETYLIPGLAAGLVAYTIPDKPHSRLQQYRLTALGQQWLRSIQPSK